jgi:hypothetical protein
MRRLLYCLSLSLLLPLGQIHAGECGSHCLGKTLKCTRCAVMQGASCDDYCRKPFPCIPCRCLPTTCDCYCRKPMPCVPCRCIPSCADDYCRKPFPKFCWPVSKQTCCGSQGCNEKRGTCAAKPAASPTSPLRCDRGKGVDSKTR